MEKKDYILREIEKISILLRAIINKLIGNRENLAVSIGDQFSVTREMLLTEGGFDLETLLKNSESENESLFQKAIGFDSENIELLADLLVMLEAEPGSNKELLFKKKALELYEYIDLRDKTFSFERNTKIRNIKMQYGID